MQSRTWIDKELFAQLVVSFGPAKHMFVAINQPTLFSQELNHIISSHFANRHSEMHSHARGVIYFYFFSSLFHILFVMYLVISINLDLNRWTL